MKMRTIRIKELRFDGPAISITIRHARDRYRAPCYAKTEESPLSKIARRHFMQLSAVAAAGLVMRPGKEANAQDMPHLEESDPVAQSLKYTSDSSTVDPASRANPAPEQHCANCALLQGNEGDEWRPCQIFPGKLVNQNGWCSVWAPKG